MPSELVITPGDIAGIGPEVMLKAAFEYLDQKEEEDPLIRFAGPREFWEREADFFELDRPKLFLESQKTKDALPLEYARGALSPACGRFAMACLEEAAAYCLASQNCGIVTAPLNKEGIRLAGYKACGHTDFLAEYAKCENCAMAFATPKLKVVLVTHHAPLLKVPAAITTKAVLEKIIQAHKMAQKLGHENPKVAVCGLNPHAGEDGVLGQEELQEIAPAIEDARILGVDAIGPLPSDSLFHFAINGRYDIVVAMYHDQGLIPVKLLDFDSGVNVTLGLPFVRTSPDHGTAYDIAGKGEANAGSALAAIRLAAKLL